MEMLITRFLFQILCVHGCARHGMQAAGQRPALWNLFALFLSVWGPGDQTQVIRPVWQVPLPAEPSHQPNQSLHDVSLVMFIILSE